MESNSFINEINKMEYNLFSLTAHQFSLTDPDVYLTDIKRIPLLDNHGRFLTINKRQEIWERESSMFCKNNSFNYWIIVLADNWKDKKKDGSDIDPINLKGMNVQNFIHCLGFIDVDMIAKNIRNYVDEVNKENKEKILKITCFDELRMINDRVLDEKSVIDKHCINNTDKYCINNTDSYCVNNPDKHCINNTDKHCINNTDNYRLTRVIVFEKMWSEIE